MTLHSIESLCGLPEKDAPMYRIAWRPSTPKDVSASAAVHAALAAQARKTAFREVKACARAYIQGEIYVSADADARPKRTYLLAPLVAIDKRAAAVAIRYLRARAGHEQRRKQAAQLVEEGQPS